MSKETFSLYIGKNRSQSIDRHGHLVGGDDAFSGEIDEVIQQAERRATLWLMSHDLPSPPLRRFYCRSASGLSVIALDTFGLLPEATRGMPKIIPEHEFQ